MIAADQCRIGAIAGSRPAYEAAVGSFRHGTVTVGAASLIVTAP
jgi:hypothetical protein